LHTSTGWHKCVSAEGRGGVERLPCFCGTPFFALSSAEEEEEEDVWHAQYWLSFGDIPIRVRDAFNMVGNNRVCQMQSFRVKREGIKRKIIVSSASDREM
jgi:hypothetical protein